MCYSGDCIYEYMVDGSTTGCRKPEHECCPHEKEDGEGPVMEDEDYNDYGDDVRDESAYTDKY